MCLSIELENVIWWSRFEFARRHNLCFALIGSAIWRDTTSVTNVEVEIFTYVCLTLICHIARFYAKQTELYILNFIVYLAREDAALQICNISFGFFRNKEKPYFFIGS